jgi:hypothetical protein
MIDLVIDRREMKTVIANALRFMGAVRKPAPVAVAELPTATSEPPLMPTIAPGS